MHRYSWYYQAKGFEGIEQYLPIEELCNQHYLHWQPLCQSNQIADTILLLSNLILGIDYLIVQKSRNGSLLIHSTGKLLSMLERGKTFFHDIIRANLHCIKDAMLLLTFVSVYCQSTACILWTHWIPISLEMPSDQQSLHYEWICFKKPKSKYLRLSGNKK